MSKPPLKLCVFDCDGTLVDSQDGIVSSMHSAFDASGLGRAADDDIRRVVGLPLEEAIVRLINPSERDKADIEGVSEAYKQAFFQLRSSGGLIEDMFPGVPDILEFLDAEGWLLGVATGKSRRGLDATLQRHGLTTYFQTLQTADIGPGKPAPDMLIRAMDEMGVQAADTLMIGDTTFDIEMAVNAGVVAIGVNWGYHHPDELKAAGAQAILSDFKELEAITHQMLTP